MSSIQQVSRIKVTLVVIPVIIVIPVVLLLAAVTQDGQVQHLYQTVLGL